MNSAIVIALVCLASAVSGASLGRIAQNVHSDSLFLNAGLDSAPGLPEPKEFQLRRNTIPVGGSVDLYYRYGFFSLSVRVIPRDDAGSWLIREPTTGIFDESTVQTMVRPGPNSFAQQPFEISLCDDLSELKEAYFRSFRAEGIAQPHKLYTGSWRATTTAKNLGLSGDSLDGDSAFVLVKLVKTSGTLDTVGDLRLKASAAGAAAKVRAGDADSVLDFVQTYGSHYIQSVSVGDAIYQVIALTKPAMEDLKSVVGGRKSLTVSEYSNLWEEYLAPWKVRETGDVRVVSGDRALTNFADKELRINAAFGSYPSLINSLMESPDKVRTLESLSANAADAVVGVNFASLKNLVGNGDVQIRQFYDEIIDNNSALWEANLA